MYTFYSVGGGVYLTTEQATKDLPPPPETVAEPQVTPNFRTRLTARQAPPFRGGGAVGRMPAWIADQNRGQARLCASPCELPLRNRG